MPQTRKTPGGAWYPTEVYAPSPPANWDTRLWQAEQQQFEAAANAAGMVPWGQTRMIDPDTPAYLRTDTWAGPTGTGTGTLGIESVYGADAGLANARGALQEDIGRAEAAQNLAISLHDRGATAIEQQLAGLPQQRDEIRALYDDIFGLAGELGEAGQDYLQSATAMAERGHTEALANLHRALGEQQAADLRLEDLLGQYDQDAAEAMGLLGQNVSYADQAREAGMGLAQQHLEEVRGVGEGAVERAEAAGQAAEAQYGQAIAGMLADRSDQDARRVQDMAQLDAQVAELRAQAADAMARVDEGGARLAEQNADALQMLKTNLQKAQVYDLGAIAGAEQAADDAQARLEDELQRQATEREDLVRRRAEGIAAVNANLERTLGEVNSIISNGILARRAAAIPRARATMRQIAASMPNASEAELGRLYARAIANEGIEIDGAAAELRAAGAQLATQIGTTMAQVDAQLRGTYESAFASQEASQARARETGGAQVLEAQKLGVEARAAAAERAATLGVAGAKAAGELAGREAEYALNRALRAEDWADKKVQMDYLTANQTMKWEDLRSAKDLSIGQLRQLAGEASLQAGQLSVGARTGLMNALADVSGRIATLGLGYAQLGAGAREAEAAAAERLATGRLEGGLRAEGVRQAAAQRVAGAEAGVQRGTEFEAGVAQAAAALRVEAVAKELAYRSTLTKDLASFNLSIEQLALNGATAAAQIIAATPVSFFTTAKHELELYGMLLAAQGKREAQGVANVARQDTRAQANRLDQTLGTLQDRLATSFEDFLGQSRAAWENVARPADLTAGARAAEAPAEHVGVPLADLGEVYAEPELSPAEHDAAFWNEFIATGNVTG